MLTALSLPPGCDLMLDKGVVQQLGLDDTVWAVPRSEIERNPNLTQNDGWN